MPRPTDREHLATLAALLATQAPHMSPREIAGDALRLLRLGRALHTLAVRECNGEGHFADGRWHWDDSDQSRADKRRDRMARDASTIAGRYTATVTAGGDPRGYVLRLHFPDKRRNGMGEGWGVA